MAFVPLLQISPDLGETQNSPQYRSNFVRTIDVRTSGDPGATASAVRQAIAEVDRNLPILSIVPMPEQIRKTVNQENTLAKLSEFFALLALFLTGIGLYGLMSYAVEQRVREIGLRMALGAKRGTVVRMILREVLGQGVAGIVLGIAATFGVTRFIASQLYGITPNDPVALAIAALAMLVCLLIAGSLPAHRASRIDPMRALRSE